MHYLPAGGPACRGSVRGQVTSSLSPSAVHAILQEHGNERADSTELIGSASVGRSGKTITASQ